jgi:hypothetical protein
LDDDELPHPIKQASSLTIVRPPEVHKQASLPAKLAVSQPQQSPSISPSGSFFESSPSSSQLADSPISLDMKELLPILEQFTNEMTYCIRLLCFPSYGPEELDQFSDPLKTLSLLLRDIMQLMKTNNHPVFKALHESTLRLVHCVKSQYSTKQFSKEPMISACTSVLAALSTFYSYCDKNPTPEEVLEFVQRYLYSMKLALDPNARPDATAAACKELIFYVVQLFSLSLKLNTSNTQLQRRIASTLCDIQENASRIVELRLNGEAPREETKVKPFLYDFQLT